VRYKDIKGGARRVGAQKRCSRARGAAPTVEAQTDSPIRCIGWAALALGSTCCVGVCSSVGPSKHTGVGAKSKRGRDNNGNCRQREKRVEMRGNKKQSWGEKKGLQAIWDG
jgi:hypothetical protein